MDELLIAALSSGSTIITLIATVYYLKGKIEVMTREIEIMRQEFNNRINDLIKLYDARLNNIVDLLNKRINGLETIVTKRR